MSLDMQHGTVSSDGRFVVVGSQDSSHLIYDEQLRLVCEVGPQHSSYPHYALFGKDGLSVALNSCHFYNGATYRVALAKEGEPVEVGEIPDYQGGDRTPMIEDGARVYAGVVRGDEYIVGDAHGYVRAFDDEGNNRWQLFIGSTVNAMALSPNGETLVVATHAGFLSIIRLDHGQAPHQIGNSNHREIRRWLFWKDEDHPLRW